MVTLTIHPELQHVLVPLSADERAQLIHNLRADGCRDALIVWEETNAILDGHNRYEICETYELPYRIEKVSLPSLDAAKAWMLRHQLGRRNLTMEQASYLRGKERELVGLQNGETLTSAKSKLGNSYQAKVTDEQLASTHKVSEKTIRNDAAYARNVDAVAAVVPDAKQAILARDTHLDRKDVKVLATMAHESPQAARHVMAAVQAAPSRKEAKQVVREAVKARPQLSAESRGYAQKPTQQVATSEPLSLTVEALPKRGLEEVLSAEKRPMFILHKPDSKPVFNRTNEMVDWASWTWNPVTGCWHDCSYCISGSTMITMADGSTLPISALRVDDAIMGTTWDGRYLRLKETEVLAHWQTVRDAYEITLANGTSVVCSADHRWLTRQRGWKYTRPGTVTRGWHGYLEGQRPFLTTTNSLQGFGSAMATLPETDHYRRGYLSGIIRGDGHFKHYPQHRQWSFRLAMKDALAIERAERYLREFGVHCARFQFAMASGEVPAIRTGSQQAFHDITTLIAWQDTAEYQRGFLAGIFDAEGSNTGALRIFNSDRHIIDACQRAMGVHGFRFIRDKTKAGVNKPIETVRMTGGIREHMRFFQLCNPAIKRKLSIDGVALKHNEDMQVVSIRPVGEAMPMYDITTGTGTFLANGLVSHNCYAREIANDERMAEAYPKQFEPTFHPARLNAPAHTPVPKVLTRPADRNVFTCSMADLFGKWVPDDWIMQVFERVKLHQEWNFLFLTKFPQRLAQVGTLLGGFPPNAWLGCTVDAQARVATAERAFQQMDAAVKWLSVEPMNERLTFRALDTFDWLVMGGQSASAYNGTPARQPEWEWVEHLWQQARAAQVKIYWKANLTIRPKEMPWEVF